MPLSFRAGCLVESSHSSPWPDRIHRMRQAMTILRRPPGSALALCLALTVAAGALAQDSVFTPQHVAKLRMVSAAVISPDGVYVAYLLSVPRQVPKEKDGPVWVELHVVDAKGTSTPYVVGQVNVDAIAWTP